MFLFKLRTMRIPLDRVVWRLLLPLLAASTLAFFFIWEPLGIAGGLGGVFLLFFFRDPERKAPKVPGGVISPADGKVVGVEEVEHPYYGEGGAYKVSIFLSLFNVHVFRSPLASRVEKREYVPGKFHVASRPKASEFNEREQVALESKEVRLELRTIAGSLARRIVSRVQEGQWLFEGERMGIVCFGSRVELFLPREAVRVCVKPGAKVKGGRSVVAFIKDKEQEE
jgi:phosphatidylserine decarboxylase